ncbi:hypothetical protein RZS08_10790, partial [Arthrospira platensis SPKY1]|nr:hypothetical protein [Arthrospira platensis SPKY1]
MTKHMMMLVLALAMLACAPPRGEKIKCYAWASGPGEMTDQELSARFADYKRKGIDGLMYNGGQDAAVYQRVGQLAKAAGLEFHAWIPTMVQAPKPELPREAWAVNGLGESALDS